LPIAIITGRSVADVETRLGFEPHFVIGNHGIENPHAVPDEIANRALDALRLRIAAQNSALARAGVAVEDKGYSLALHYRLPPPPRGAPPPPAPPLSRLSPALPRA